jgi:hypothetical protein
LGFRCGVSVWGFGVGRVWTDVICLTQGQEFGLDVRTFIFVQRLLLPHLIEGCGVRGEG